MVEQRSRGSRIERDGGQLVIAVRTYRSGDLVHFVFGPLCVAFGVLVLWIALRNGTLFGSWATVPLVTACFAYGWFAATRASNRRTLVAGVDRVSVFDGPLPSLARRVEIPLRQLGQVRTRKEKRWIPPIWFHDVYHVEAVGTSRPLFKSLDSEEEALRIRAAVMAFKGRS